MLASPIGHYLSAHSFMHERDPRVKTVAFIVLIFSTAFISTPAQLAVFCALVALFIALSGTGLSPVWTSVKPIVPFALLIAVFNLFAVQGGETLAHLGPLVISTAGAWAALLYATRLILAVALGALLLLTTTPTAITDAFESVLSPFALTGLPVHEIAMVFSLALRFVPILADETQSVIDAQRARGGSIEDGTLAERTHALGAILVAVFAGAMRHAQNLSRALDARCYEGGTKRTHYREYRISTLDILLAGICILWLCALVVLGIVL